MNQVCHDIDSCSIFVWQSYPWAESSVMFPGMCFSLLQISAVKLRVKNIEIQPTVGEVVKFHLILAVISTF